MPQKILLTTAYFPPSEYFSLISKSDEILIEHEENYLKQSYRNRCYILSSHGPQSLTVPVLMGSTHKIPIKDIRIDYTKRWKQVHLRAIRAAYGSSPYFQFYFEYFEKTISKNIDFLVDLNSELTVLLIEMLKLNKTLTYTTSFQSICSMDNDFRYRITPKNPSCFSVKEYIQVFHVGSGFVGRLSILDLIFNTGPEACTYL